MKGELWKRIRRAEERLTVLEIGQEQNKVTEDLKKKQVYSYGFVQTSGDYYSWTLQKRASYLGCEVSQLCKTVLFENTAKSDTSTGDASDSKYYFVIVQYQAKIDVDLLRDTIMKLRSGNSSSDALPKKRFNFMLAPEQVSDELTGFIHNGVCPFALKDQSIPILICERVLEQPVVFLGGGHPHLKLKISTKELSEAGKTHTGVFSIPRSRLELSKLGE